MSSEASSPTTTGNWLGVDDFGVPIHFFGRHREEFYGAIGRIALLAALVDYQALTIYQTMLNLPQTTDTQLPARKLVDKARKALEPIREDENRKSLSQYFGDIDEVIRERNSYIHSLWPAQPGEELYGWRPTRDKNAPANKPNDFIQTNLGELEDFILRLVEIVQRRDRIWVAARVLQEIKLHAEAMS